MTIDQDALYNFFNDIPGDGRCLYIDTFVSLCWMHQQGQKRPAVKLMTDLLARINRLSDGDHHELIQELLDSLDGNEQKYAMTVPLRAEFRQLFSL